MTFCGIHHLLFCPCLATRYRYGGDADLRHQIHAGTSHAIGPCQFRQQTEPNFASSVRATSTLEIKSRFRVVFRLSFVFHWLPRCGSFLRLEPPCHGPILFLRYPPILNWAPAPFLLARIFYFPLQPWTLRDHAKLNVTLRVNVNWPLVRQHHSKGRRNADHDMKPWLRQCDTPVAPTPPPTSC
jgi:hypothetical protein